MEFNNIIIVEVGKKFTIKDRHKLRVILSAHMFKTMLIEADKLMFVSKIKDFEINYENINKIVASIKEQSKYNFDINKITISKVCGETEFTSMLK